MTTTAEDVFLLASDHSSHELRRPGLKLVRGAGLREAFQKHPSARWVAVDTASLSRLVRTIVGFDGRKTRRLLALEPMQPSRRELLETAFRIVIAAGNGIRLLDKEELAEVLASEAAVDLFIGGTVDADGEAIVLFRGNLERLVVPFRWFRRHARSIQPNFNDFQVVDYGNTVRLGTYEAAADAILYDLDANARRRMKKRELEKDASFGAALKRLRLERGLRRDQFPGVAEKTIARIERNEIDKPHGRTLTAIADRLGVAPDEIASY
jgi:hypothetical protein